MLLFPSWRYHATAPPRLVQDADQDAALPPGWYDSPVTAAAAAAEAQAQDKAEADRIAAELEARKQSAQERDLARNGDLSVAKAAPIVAEMTDAHEVRAWLAAEQRGDNRKGMIAVLETRLAELNGLVPGR